MTILNADGSEAVVKLPKIKAAHPTGSKILVECLKADEVLGTDLVINDNTDVGGAPQAYVVELGPGVPDDSGISVGQRVYWEGKGLAIDDPRAECGRVRALLEIHNIKAIIEEEAN